jgi:hypothetical protein
MALIAGFFVLFALAGVALVAFAVVVGLLKLVFKVALFPVVLAFGAVKLVMVVVGAVVGLVLMLALGPVLLAVAIPLMILALPLLLLGGIAWTAVHVLA